MHRPQGDEAAFADRRRQGDQTALARRRRAPTALRVTLQLAAIAVLAFVAAPFGCALSDTNGGGGAPGQLCKQGDNAKCADGNVCHANICNNDGFCETKNRVGDPPDPKPGDCHKVICTGTDGDTPKTIVDPTDVDDDGNDCTTDTCDNGMPKHAPVDPGTKCKYQGHTGACNGKTDCEIPCTGGDDCTTTDACTIGACNLANNKCSFMRLDGVAPPGVPPVVGDCLDMTCVKGVTQEFGDPDDLPKVGACYTPTCDPGDKNRPLMPGKTPKDPRTGCMADGGSICDGKGNCVQCIVDADCGTDGNDCHTPTCSPAGKCSFPNTPMGPSPALNAQNQQHVGDCHQIECDGNGGTTNAIDTGDPANGGNPCLNYYCDAGGNNQTSQKMDGTNCGSGLSCSNGGCSGCTTNNQCPNHPLERCDAPNCDCPGNGLQLKTCASQGLTCGSIADTGCGAPVGCDDGKDGQETDVDCGGPSAACATRCAQGKTCGTGGDCASGFCVDGVCCESACTTSGCYACSNALTNLANGLCRPIVLGHSAKSGCNAAPPCGNTGLCDGAGSCQKTAGGTPCGSTCTMATETPSQCNGTGSCMGITPVLCAPYQCNSNGMTCLTTCGGDPDCTAGNYCSSGMCGSLKGNGDTCSMGPECTSGNCVDMVCCSTSSCGTCRTCNGSSPGTCSNVVSADDPGTCDGTHSGGSCGSPPCHCDSGGNCVSGCGVDADCPNCQSCQGGTCTNVAKGTQTAGRCDDNDGGCGGMCSGCGNKCACDNANHCLLKAGQGCTCDQNCASGTCSGSTGNCNNGATHFCN